MTKNSITASKLYDYIKCPHKVWRDVYGPLEEKTIETNPFVELLWNKGVQHEKNIIEKIVSFLNLSEGSFEERKVKTLEAIKNKEKIIYQGIIQDGDLVGIPDLLILENEEYIPVDIKSGMGTDGDDSDTEAKLKKHYAVQLALYIEILQRMNLKTNIIGKVIDSTGVEVIYDLSLPMGVKDTTTYWEYYLKVKEQVSQLLANKVQNKPAMAGVCKLCQWYASCKQWCKDQEDPTLIYYLGRKVRDTLDADLNIQSIPELLKIDAVDLLQKKKKDKSFLRGVGESTLNKALRRAEILSNNLPPVLYSKIDFPKVQIELFFDIEDDPTQEYVYMHGVYERRNQEEQFIHFTAKAISPEEEKSAWSNFWKYIYSLPKDGYAVYYYSHHEKTTYLKLQQKYPDVISQEEVEAFFNNPNVIDLFKIVNESTDWPVGSYSLKELATYLGFKWRDETPSGALSIQWFNEYIDKKDEKLLERILLYNEDDCKATLILKDAIEKMNNENLIIKGNGQPNI